MALSRRVDRALAVAAALGIGTYFWRLARPTLHLYFTPDDSMNLFRAWDAPARQLIEANLLFFLSSHFYRPLAEAWYRVIYHFAGFNPAPFHAALLAILFVNIFLTYAVARRLSGSRETGAVAALIGCYHPRLADLYFDTGYIYDVLCYCFYFAAFLLYLRVRQGERFLRVWEASALWVLYACALSSKEMAVTLPVFLVIYELLYHPGKWRGAGLRQLVLQAWPILLLVLTTAVFVVCRSLGAETLLNHPAYRPVFTLQQFLATSCNFVGDMFDLQQRFQTWWLLAIWAAMLAVAWLSRSRSLRFAWLFVMLSPLPIAFLLPRGAAQYYLPWFGWTLFVAVLVTNAAAWITRRFAAETLSTARIRGAAVLLLLMVLLYPYYKRQDWRKAAIGAAVDAEGYRAIVRQLHALAPVLPAGSRLLFLNDPVPPDVFDLMFLVRLSYRDHTLRVDRVRQMQTPPTPQQIRGYDYVFDYADGRFREQKP